MSILIPKLDKLTRIFEQFDLAYDIHFCRIDEIDDLMAFIDTYWRKNHILAKSKEFMDWQHLDKTNNRYNFVLAREKKTNEIHAILGFIQSKQFDENITSPVLWGAIWKIREDVTPPGLGCYLFQYLTTEIESKLWVNFGISDDSKKNNKQMGFTLCKSQHYFLVNSKIEDFKIASGILKYREECSADSESYSMIDVTEDYVSMVQNDDPVFDCVKPFKSKQYYVNRYLKHPVYKYKCYAVKKDIDLKLIFFVREVSANSSKCLRIVDVIGKINELQNVRKSLADIMSNGAFEYIDLISSNQSDSELRACGFVNKDINPEIIIPNYFEPFVQKNVEMDYSYITTLPDMVIQINKGDSDQDRPNSLL